MKRVSNMKDVTSAGGRAYWERHFGLPVTTATADGDDQDGDDHDSTTTASSEAPHSESARAAYHRQSAHGGGGVVIPQPQQLHGRALWAARSANGGKAPGEK